MLPFRVGSLLELPTNIRPGLKRLAKDKHSSLFVLFVSDKDKKFYNIDTCGKFNKHFKCATYGHSKTNCTVHCRHAFAMVVSYKEKMFIKSTPGPNVIKLFLSVIYEFS